MTKVFDQYDKRGNRMVLRLKKTIYGIFQSPRSFWDYLTQKLIASRMLQSNLDPCIFIIDKVICIVYVYDLIFWEKDKSEIHNLSITLPDIGIDLEQEWDVAGFTGVNFEYSK